MSFLQRAYLSKAPGFQKNHASALQKHVMVKASLKRTFEHARSNLKTTKNHWKRFRKTLALYQAVTFQWLHQLKFLWTTWLQHCQQDLTVQKLFSGRFSPFLKFRSWIFSKTYQFSVKILVKSQFFLHLKFLAIDYLWISANDCRNVWTVICFSLQWFTKYLNI